MKKFYPNLNSLRFIAASLVIIHHIELYKTFFNLPNHWDIDFFKVIGKLGVVLFFVLSGFLITSLMFHEEELKGFVSIKKFYLRRVFRIWPLYYLIIFVGFFIFPYLPFFDIPDKNIFPDVFEYRSINILFYLTIFANVAIPIFGNVPYVSQTWSIATEEQFYVIWPLIFVFFRKKLLPMIFMLIVGYWIIKFINDKTSIPYHFVSGKTRLMISEFLLSFNINCMGLGALFAYLIHYELPINKYILNNKIFIFTSILTVTLLLLGFKFGFFHYDVYALFFAIIIVNLACNENYSTLMENKVTSHLGAISYGLYMYHFIALTIAIRVAIYFEALWIIYPITFILTIIISHFSYKYFENYFLKLKSKFD